MDSSSQCEDIEVRLFLEAIYSRYGYDLRGYMADSMQRRVKAALARSGLVHLGELQHRVICDPNFFANVLHDLTVHVSEMFRDPKFYKLFRSRVVPILRTYPLIRIWHAGCATGEEAYASAIILSEEGLYDRAQIYATDLSPNTLEYAKQGVYPAAQAAVFRQNYEQSGGPCHLSDYYTAAYDRVALKESLRRNILFFQHDLVADHAFGEMHVIFCRNVFIYFGPDLRARVLDKFADGICVGGFLCLGSSERLSGATKGSFADFEPEHRIYRHVGGTHLG